MDGLEVHWSTQELPAKLLLIGEGPDTILARRQITKKGLADKVMFLGNQSRVEAVLPCADLFLLPSEEESFGLAALEALACGVPVVGSSGTGLVEVVDDYTLRWTFKEPWAAFPGAVLAGIPGWPVSAEALKNDVANHACSNYWNVSLVGLGW